MWSEFQRANFVSPSSRSVLRENETFIVSQTTLVKMLARCIRSCSAFAFFLCEWRARLIETETVCELQCTVQFISIWTVTHCPLFWLRNLEHGTWNGVKVLTLVFERIKIQIVNLTCKSLFYKQKYITSYYWAYSSFNFKSSVLRHKTKTTKICQCLNTCGVLTQMQVGVPVEEFSSEVYHWHTLNIPVGSSGVSSSCVCTSKAKMSFFSCTKMLFEHMKDLTTYCVWVFIPTVKNFCRYDFCSVLTICFFAYQGIEHQSIKSVTVRVLHHDVEESIQSVLQELEWQTHIIMWQANNKTWHSTKKKTHMESLSLSQLFQIKVKLIIFASIWWH